MKIKDYLVEVQRTMIHPTLKKDELIQNFGLCVFEECGEVTSIIKKHLYHNHLLDTDKLIKELGDLLWYVVALSKLKNFDFEQIYKHSLINELKVNGVFKNMFYLQSVSFKLSQEFILDNDEKEYSIYNFMSYYLEFIKEFDLKIETIMSANIDKLKKRYKEKFTFDESIKRED